MSQEPNPEIVKIVVAQALQLAGISRSTRIDIDRFTEVAEMVMSQGPQEQPIVWAERVLQAMDITQSRSGRS